jgi:pyruvyltransferase
MNKEGGNFSVTYNGAKIIPDSTMNWGDLIPFEILSFFSKSKKLKEDDVFNVKYPNKNYKIYSTGSVMLFTKPHSIVWGTGCIEPNSIGQVPGKIYAVRGPLTRQQLIKKDIFCPEVYGDPALLYPQIYNPKIKKRYEYGIIPHYIEYFTPHHNEIVKRIEDLGIKIIDICSGNREFINQLLEVEKVVSSSLHGLIVADAYNIPNSKVNISNRLFGGQFKFNDYYLSTERSIDPGLQLTKETSLNEIQKLKFNTKIKIDLEKLLAHSPWKDPFCENIFY